jgi:hypothetical protein
MAALCALAGTAAAAPDLDAIAKDAPGCDAVRPGTARNSFARKTCIGLALHVAVGDAGAVASADWLKGQLAGANQHFEKLDVEFRIVSIDALPATATRVEDRKERDSFAPQVKGKLVHVFVTGALDDIDIPGGNVYGVAWHVYGRGGPGKLIILSTQAWERTLAHELGHVFGLPHSKYAISIMNKTDRQEPPIEQRTFAPKELAAMKPRIAWMLRAKLLEDRR